MTKFVQDNADTEPINISFSSTQLTKLHTLVKGQNEVTVHDTLCT